MSKQELVMCSLICSIKRWMYNITFLLQKVQPMMHENFTKRKMPKVEDWYPVYADRPNSYQADLMFEHYVNSKTEVVLQAILCVLNINTKYMFA